MLDLTDTTEVSIPEPAPEIDGTEDTPPEIERIYPVFPRALLEQVMLACGLGEDAVVSSLEINGNGVLVTSYVRIDDGTMLNLKTPTGDHTLQFTYFVPLEPLPEIHGEHTHDDGTVHTHDSAPDQDLVQLKAELAELRGLLEASVAETAETV